MDCQRHFTKLQKMKNTQSEIKPMKFGKQPGATYCLTHNFRPQELKITNKVLIEKLNCAVCRSNKSKFSKQKQQ